VNPYDVLDVSPKLTMKEITVRYREQLLLHHPDLHTQEGPAAVREAERKTRELNEAMALLRQQHPKEGVNFTSTPGAPGGSGSFGAEDAVTFAWEKKPTRAMACPLCGNDFPGGVADVERHLLDVHEIDVRAKPKQARRRRRMLTKGERKALRTLSYLALFIILIGVAAALGSFRRLTNGEFDPLIPIVVLAWGVVLARVILKKQ
jgi:hypothetical protein